MAKRKLTAEQKKRYAEARRKKYKAKKRSTSPRAVKQVGPSIEEHNLLKAYLAYILSKR